MRIYPTGGPIEELGGTIRGGVTIVMNSPGEVRMVGNTCAAARYSNAPFHALYGLLNAVELPETPTRQFEWLDWNEIGLKDFDHAGRGLMAAFSYVEALWERTANENFTCVLTLARPEGDMRLDLNVHQTGLVFHFGSILATLAKGALSVTGWSLALFSGRGIGSSMRADHLVEDLRAEVLKRAGTDSLERLDCIVPNELKRKKAIIVLMHGLFSTDAGLFDPLLKYLRADNGFDHCAIVGWPHNTLANINGNAVELLQLFSYVIGLDGPQVAFVCHSRGGLVARAGAVELCEAHSGWRHKLKGCVTFGTPHRGASLAETPNSPCLNRLFSDGRKKPDGSVLIGEKLETRRKSSRTMA